MNSLEEALSKHEKELDSVLRLNSQLGASLKAWKKAVGEGNLGERQKQAARSAELAGRISEPITAVADAWTFDAGAYLSSEEWSGELEAAARGAGHQVFLEGDGLISAPVLVRADPSRLSLRIGKTRWPKLRPSLVVAELKRIREQGLKEKRILDFLEKLCDAAKYLDDHPRENGAVKAKIRDIYDLFAMAPGWKKENPESVFTQDLYALHRSELRVTRSGKKYEFEFPTGHPKDREIFQVIDDTGRPIRYYMIHFR